MNVTEPGEPTEETRPVTPYDPSIPGRHIRPGNLVRRTLGIFVKCCGRFLILYTDIFHIS